MATRHPDGTDAEYLQWHTLDHRPEQHRLSAVRASLRLVSTPACRAARAVERRAFRPGRSRDDLLLQRHRGSGWISHAVRGAGRRRSQTATLAARRTRRLRRCRAEWPRRGSKSAPTCCRGGRPAACTCYWKRTRHRRPNWSTSTASQESGRWPRSTSVRTLASARAGQQLTYCFLDDDPVATAARLRPVLEKRWNATDIDPLFAAPFHPVVPHEWEPLCALTAGARADRSDGRLRQGAPTRRPPGRIARRRPSAENAGFTSFWIPQVPGYLDAMTAIALLGQVTNRIEIGSAVVPIQTRHPVADGAAGVDHPVGMRRPIRAGHRARRTIGSSTVSWACPTSVRLTW